MQLTIWLYISEVSLVKGMFFDTSVQTAVRFLHVSVTSAYETKIRYCDYGFIEKDLHLLQFFLRPLFTSTAERIAIGFSFLNVCDTNRAFAERRPSVQRPNCSAMSA